MSIEVTVGENDGQLAASNSRGTVTVAPSRRSDTAGEESMIEVSTTLRNTKCTVRITIAEADILQRALDGLVLEAAVPGLGTDSTARESY